VFLGKGEGALDHLFGLLRVGGLEHRDVRGWPEKPPVLLRCGQSLLQVHQGVSLPAKLPDALHAERSENAGQLEVRVVRAGALDPGVSVDYATTNGSAAAGSDYEAVAGTLFFGEGQT
jgi:hypothetical protein